MEPLNPEDILPYLRHRIQVAGGKFEDVFKSGVEPTFYWFSGGCPRLISLLADRVLLSAYAAELRPIPPEFVERKAKAMGDTRAAGLSTTDRGWELRPRGGIVLSVRRQ